MIYELINPSDPYTFIAPDREAAALVVGILGTAYGAEATENDSDGVPVMILGGFNEWYLDTFGRDIEAGLKARRKDLVSALRSFVYGRPEERNIYEKAMSAIDDPEKKAGFKKEWQNRRSSMNNIGETAWLIGERLDTKQEED